MKLKSTMATEIYVSEAGYIAIKQLGDHGAEDDIVVLSPEQAKVVALELNRLADDFGPEWQVDAGDGPADG